jgi:hypothetical protein
MRKLLVILFFSLAANTYSQESKITDELLRKVCNSIDSNKSLNDSARVTQAFQKHLFPVMDGMSETQAREAQQRVFYRLQQTCLSFKRILEKLDPVNKGDWQEVDSKPLPAADKSVCKEFAQRKNYSYLERSGDTVHITVDNGIWTDRFEDGTYSKLHFRWISDCEFQIEFIESNNRSRKNFSKPGDKFSYQILSRENGAYLMSAQIVGQDRFMTFKLYFNDNKLTP